MEVREEGEYIPIAIHCHHQNDSCIKLGSDEIHLLLVHLVSHVHETAAWLMTSTKSCAWVRFKVSPGASCDYTTYKLQMAVPRTLQTEHPLRNYLKQTFSYQTF